MTPENFVYWLQGLLELGSPKKLNEAQVRMIKEHIALVLRKETLSSINKIEYKKLNNIVDFNPSVIYNCGEGSC